MNFEHISHITLPTPSTEPLFFPVMSPSTFTSFHFVLFVNPTALSTVASMSRGGLGFLERGHW